MKAKKRGRKLRTMLALALPVSVIILFAVARSHVDYGTNRDQRHLQKTLGKYLGSLDPKKDWWVVSARISPDQTEFKALELALRNVQNAIQREREAAPFAKEIAERFGDRFYASMFLNGISRTSTIGEASQEDLKNKTEVCFFGMEDKYRMDSPLLFYRGDWRAIMIAAVKWPTPFFDAVLLHELGHALLHERGKPTSGANTEVELHEFEAIVLNYATKGGYFREMEYILRRHFDAANERALLGSIRTNELYRLDVSVGVQ